MRALLALLVASCAGSAHAAEARYTDVNFDACAVEEVFEEGVGAALTCEGLDGIPVYVTEGDLRFDVDFGARNGATETFGPFNYLGPRIEWRVEDGKAFATILRFVIENPEGGADPADKGSVLGVFQIGTQEAPGCAVAYVDALANDNANEIARQVADAFARPFRCGTDRATYVGHVGPKAGSATATHEPR
ncbi:hypothetical protein [Aureimonas mangrovi]|uniref:hypothetical protein n=1 Tax=Aureimonas mangrovi TaxID=2758041 RepID=UPI00163DDDE5|nr:hypothetical protein [Aureimonas mangrovi]